ncbi:MAG TPA: DNA translocase FtsK 4TM domain-containing protein [Thermoleophilaceae bacterium]|nr:DNA translocase FtsK 4TM domain-containing protein [Thermoleophilaceae bacterium]
MAGTTTRKKTATKKRKPPTMSDRLRVPRLPELEQQQADVWGIGLVLASVLFAFVFYFGWDGGKVGSGIADGLRWLFGGVAYLTPLALFVTGTLLVMRPLLTTVRPFKSGGICLLTALMLGLAAGTFGLGPSHPARHGAFAQPEFFKVHGGLVGESLYWVTSTLFSRVGAHLIFVFLLIVGIMLLTGASISGVIAATRKQSEPQPKPKRVKVPEVEPAVVKQTHVEAPVVEDAQPNWEPEPEPAPEAEPEPEAPPEAVDDEHGVAALTPMGNKRGGLTEADENTDYRLPNPSLLKRSNGKQKTDPAAEARTGAQLVEALSHFDIPAQVVGTVAGPHVTRYELRLAPGIKMAKVANLKDDLAYALAAPDVRILAPIPGKQAIGVEVPNSVRKMVHLGDVLQESPSGWSPLTVWLGKDIGGKAIGTDLAKQPHILIAGTTGSGKSGCVNALLSSILLRATPNEVRLVLVDPKQVELNYYESIPHLLTPVVTSPRLAASVLQNLIREMEQRYTHMAPLRARNIIELNKIRVKMGEPPLPYILCVIDELADLMMVAPTEVEDAIIRLAQKARAVGIHLVLATQRPSADVITGLIKANVPARIAFAVSSQVDSRVILDSGGAESLLGQGDMLFRPVEEGRPKRVQGAFISEEEIEKLTAHWRRQGEPEIQEELLEVVEKPGDEESGDGLDPDSDDLLGEAIATVVQMGTASTSMLQRRLRVGYTRAGRLIDMMERRGVISGYEGSKARQVLISEADLPRVLEALGDAALAAADPDT